MRVFTSYYCLFVLGVAAIAIFMLPKKYRRVGDEVLAKVTQICGYVYAILVTALFVAEHL